MTCKETNVTNTEDKYLLGRFIVSFIFLEYIGVKIHTRKCYACKVNALGWSVANVYRQNGIV